MVYNNETILLDICKKANYSYLQKVLLQIKDSKQKENVINLFNKHMQQIADFCMNNFLKTGILTQKFIRELHKIHFPPWYQKMKKTISWDAFVVIMIPWVYKTWNTNFNRVSPKDTKTKMQELIDNYNQTSIRNLDFILEFALNFYKIHPFWDWNGRVLSILLDLILIKNSFKPIFIKNIIDSNPSLYKKIIDDSIKNNDKNLFINKIKSYF